MAVEKICKVCGEKYEATSNRQEKCPACAKKAKQKKDREYSKKVKRVYREVQKNNASLGSDGTHHLIERLLEKRRKIDTAIEVLKEMSE